MDCHLLNFFFHARVRFLACCCELSLIRMSSDQEAGVKCKASSGQPSYEMAMRVMFLNPCAPKRPRHCPSLDAGDPNRYTWERPRLSCLQDRAKIKLITSLAKRNFIHTLESQTRRVSASPERAPPADHCQIMEPQIAWSLYKHSSPMLKQGAKLDQGQRRARGRIPSSRSGPTPAPISTPLAAAEDEADEELLDCRRPP